MPPAEVPPANRPGGFLTIIDYFSKAVVAYLFISMVSAGFKVGNNADNIDNNNLVPDTAASRLVSKSSSASSDGSREITGVKERKSRKLTRCIFPVGTVLDLYVWS